MDKYIIIYKVRLSGDKYDPRFIKGTQKHVVGDIEHADSIIRKLHPDMVRYWIDSIGSVKFISNAGLGPFRIMVDEYMEKEEDKEREHGPNSIRALPKDKYAVSANFTSYADPPEVGWWSLYLKFTSVVRSPDKFMVQILISCSDVFDPFDDLLSFLGAIARGESAVIMIDEEGKITRMESCPLKKNKIQLCITKMHEENIQYNFILDKNEFVLSLWKTYVNDFIQYIEANVARGGEGQYMWGYADFDED